MNEGLDLSKKIQTDYGRSLKPSTGRMYDMLNNSTSIELYDSMCLQNQKL